MLKKRILYLLPFDNGVFCRTKQFKPDYRYTSSFVDPNFCDELVLLNVSNNKKTDQSFSEFLSTLFEMSSRTFIPVTAGGGIHSEEQVKLLLEHGADKVVINSWSFEINNRELSSAIDRFGSQCFVGSVDYRIHDGSVVTYKNSGSSETGFSLKETIKHFQSLDVGELLFNSIDRDGSLEGLDLGLLQQIASLLDRPTLVAGGLGNWRHMKEALDIQEVSGVATSNVYHLTQSAMKLFRQKMAENGILVRKP